jgi:hypothetical protein
MVGRLPNRKTNFQVMMRSTLPEDDGKEQMAFDSYRAAANLYVKLEK